MDYISKKIYFFSNPFAEFRADKTKISSVNFLRLEKPCIIFLGFNFKLQVMCAAMNNICAYFYEKVQMKGKLHCYDI